MTIKDAAARWVEEFNAIPQSVIVKLLQRDEEVSELTPPTAGDRVYIYEGEHSGEGGEITAAMYDDSEMVYSIQVDGEGDVVTLASDQFEVERDDFLPMWGTMWSFGSKLDEWWLEEKEGLQSMADCGFRIYEQEDYGYIFGIDGAGYDFFEEHWIPLYNARGIKWHESNKRGD